MKTLRLTLSGLAPRLGASFALLGALLPVLGGCLSEEKRAEKEERDRLTVEMFRELIEQGTLTPVESMEDPFAEISPDMGATPEQRRGAAQVPGAGAPPEEEPAEKPENYVELPQVNPFVRFGRRIKVHEGSGLITKPFPMPAQMAQNVLVFLEKYGGFLTWAPQDGQLPGEQPLERIRVEIATGVDSSDPKLNSSWLVVTASPELLEDVEYFINTFAASPPQIEIEAKIVEWLVRETLDLGVSDASALFPDHTLIKSLEWTFPNNAGEILGGEFVATMGTIHDGVTYSAMFEALASFENVSIISRPKVAVREGIEAMIKATTEYPYLKVTGINPAGNITTAVAFQEVGVTLTVTPRLVGTGTIELLILVEESQRTGSAVTLATGGGVGESGFIDTPIFAKRTAKTDVLLRPGQAVILGGLITERTTEREDGIPILMDIPVLGYLFKSTFDETEQATLLFFIRPRILEGTDLTQEF